MFEAALRLLLADLWRWNAVRATVFDHVYHGFNLFEAAAWFTIGAYVLWRRFRHGRAPIELVYAAAFFTFGLTDIQEGFRLQPWLILAKGLNLLALLALRDHILKRTAVSGEDKSKWLRF